LLGHRLRPRVCARRHAGLVCARQDGTRAGRDRGACGVSIRQELGWAGEDPDHQTQERLSMAIIDIKVPDIGDFKDVAIIEVLVKAGDTIAKEQSLITVESDKASMEIPASHAGVVKELKVKVGDKISEGSLLLTLES